MAGVWFLAASMRVSMSLEDYLGDMRFYLDAFFERFPGGIEFMGAPHRLGPLMPTGSCRWRINSGDVKSWGIFCTVQLSRAKLRTMIAGTGL